MLLSVDPALLLGRARIQTFSLNYEEISSILSLYKTGQSFENLRGV
jgi:hypothetical protein